MTMGTQLEGCVLELRISLSCARFTKDILLSLAQRNNFSKLTSKYINRSPDIINQLKRFEYFSINTRGVAAAKDLSIYEIYFLSSKSSFKIRETSFFCPGRRKQTSVEKDASGVIDNQGSADHSHCG